MEDITAREQLIFNYIKQEIQTNGIPPTVRDICAALNINSTSTVQKEIENLVSAGYLEKINNKRRTIRVVSQVNEDTTKIIDNIRADVVDVPVIGRVAAGTPILAEQNIEDSFPLPSRFVGNGTTFMLTVHGESMIEVGIFDGDYLLVHQQNTAENGQIVVAMINGDYESEATVKTFYKENGHIRLQPENSSMAPIIVPDCQIVGVVKGVFRYF